VIARICGSRSTTRPRMKAAFTSPRSRSCFGGSLVPSVLPMRAGSSSRTLPRADEKRFASLQALAMSS
jgi:hypothetical protein